MEDTELLARIRLLLIWTNLLLAVLAVLGGLVAFGVLDVSVKIAEDSLL